MDLTKLTRPGMFSFAAQRLCTWYPLRLKIAGLIAKNRPQRPDLTNVSAAKTAVDTLEKAGIFMMPQFVSHTDVQRINQHLVGAVLKERFPPRRTGFTLDAVPHHVHVAEYETAHLLKCPEIVALLSHPLLIDTATRYLGCKPTISNLSVWWSLPTDGSAQEAENYHRDVDDWRFVKFFLYLTDVTAGSGPHKFVRGSNKRGNFLRNTRYSDEVVEGQFAKEDCLTILGNSGDAFMEDTFGLHKGQPPISEQRLVLQIQFSINPIAVYNYNPQAVVDASGNLDPYISRLYVKHG